MTYIGIDTGTNTGVAVWDTSRHCFKQLDTMPIHRAMETVIMWRDVVGRENISVIFEDARLRKWYDTNSNAKLQGAGSIKRDASIWEDFLTDKGIPFLSQAPSKGMTKWNDQTFKAVTGWSMRTSNHARDAALLVFGR
mgnify:CR=1 FL=1